eukprot:TRINITY_DN351_c0_g1_i1.p2 TRINITY_DN351_c0_g1~~TRINITY_DN351_c0_g1_i1.p2  ORF type:complete len:185 (+),score=26.16 TRINITY_DN351_c0_g1_i1:64-555(+)
MCIRDRYMGIIYMEERVDVDITKEEHDDLCCVYASLILHDGGVAITEEKIRTLVEASGNDICPGIAEVFAKAIQGINIDALIFQMGIPTNPLARLAVEESKKEIKKQNDVKNGDDGPEVGNIGDLFGDCQLIFVHLQTRYQLVIFNSNDIILLSHCQCSTQIS